MTEENQKFLCSILSYPQKKKKKKHAFFSWPPHLHFPFWHCLTSHKRNGDKCNRSICWLQNSHIEKDKVCYASIQKYNRCLATCTSTVSVCCKRKKIKNIFFFFFGTGITHRTGCYQSHQLIKQPRLRERKALFHGLAFTPSGTSSDKQAQIPFSLSRDPISGLTNYSLNVTSNYKLT